MKQERWLVDRHGYITVQEVEVSRNLAPEIIEHQGKVYKYSETNEGVLLYAEVEEP